METTFRLHLVLLTCASLLSPGRGEYFITTTPTKVEVGITEGFTMECSLRGDPIKSIFQSITRMRILKVKDQNDFEIVAEARDFETEAHNTGLGPTANVTGFVGNVTSSYLSIYWNLVTSSVLGRYRCDIVGFQTNQDVAIERTPVYDLKESHVTIMDVIDLTNKQKAELEQELHAQKVYCDSRISMVGADLDAKIAAFKLDQESTIKAIEADLLKHLAVLATDVDRLMDTGVLQYWPEGRYALLMPNSGCPSNVGALWSSGYRIFHTESTDRNYDAISATSHLMAPVLQRIGINNFMYQHFCVSRVHSPGAQWPKGSYCINQVSHVCPSGFSSGSMTWQDEVTGSRALDILSRALTGSKANVSGLLPDGLFTANTTSFIYCCRSDGHFNEPNYLPKSQPFYLYRYNGMCEEQGCRNYFRNSTKCFLKWYQNTPKGTKFFIFK